MRVNITAFVLVAMLIVANAWRIYQLNTDSYPWGWAWATGMINGMLLASLARIVIKKI